MAFADPIPNEPNEVEVIPPTQPESETSVPQTDTQEHASNVEDSGAIFQAVGIIIGSVKFTDENKSTVTISRKEYQLFYAPRKQRAYEALKKEIEATGEHTQRLVVYPKAIHFPKRDQPHRIAFQLVGFDKGREEEAVSGELQDLEFKLSGLWQFIPVCPTPCISVFRNFSRERLEYIKQAEPAKKVKFMKASHLPVLWKDAPVRPFRFNPKAGKDQGHPAFVEIKAKFLPHRDVFGFVEQIGEPRETAPKFLKASKKDKATVQNAAKPRKQAEGDPSKGDVTKPRKKINPIIKSHKED
jgi:hypothetical protein